MTLVTYITSADLSFNRVATRIYHLFSRVSRVGFSKIFRVSRVEFIKKSRILTGVRQKSRDSYVIFNFNNIAIHLAKYLV